MLIFIALITQIKRPELKREREIDCKRKRDKVSNNKNMRGEEKRKRVTAKLCTGMGTHSDELGTKT